MGSRDRQMAQGERVLAHDVLSTCRKRVRKRQGREGRTGRDSLMSPPATCGSRWVNYAIDWHQAEMPANCLISHDCREIKSQTG